MFRRVGKWMVLATVGVLVAGVVGLSAVYAQGPNPARTPQAGCPVAGRPFGMGWRWGGGMLQTWADALGLKVEELAAAVQSGKSVADLAKEKGMTIEALVDKAVEARKAAVQQAVEAGRLTQEQADAMLQQMRERMTENLQNGTCMPGTRNGPGRGQGACWGSSGQPDGRPARMVRQLRQAAPSQQ